MNIVIKIKKQSKCPLQRHQAQFYESTLALKYIKYYIARRDRRKKKETKSTGPIILLMNIDTNILNKIKFSGKALKRPSNIVVSSGMMTK